ncbi:MAG: GDP-mannose 4,6-dehydratase, partial [Methanocorpusculum sp.]|nr:GDP-mannose 4,6-dehydratase [Methanocorpusculum sp.]
DGNQTRDFVFVKDVARANILAMDSDVCGLFNIGTGVQTSLNDLANLIMDAAGVCVEVKYEAAREGDVRYSVADISKAGHELGYVPEWDLSEGVKETVEYFREISAS